MASNRQRYNIRFVKMRELRELFLEIPSNILSNDISIYQSLEYLSITGKGRKIRRSNLWSLRGIVEENIIQYSDSQVCAISTLLINKTQKEVVLRGHYTSAGQLGFIHKKTWSYEAFCNLIEAIQSKYPNYTINFDRIKQDTLCWEYFIRYFSRDNCSVSKTPCVSICISDGYDAWYANLSKSTRQNIRTSYNRIRKANISLQLKISRGGKEKTTTTLKRIILHTKRTLVKHNYDSSGILHKLIMIAQAINEYVDPMTKALNRMEDSLTAEVFFDGKPVAFFRGFISEGNRLIIPQLTIDSEFGFYSPGGILINESIKYLTTNTEGLRIDQFDLSRGDEPYKLVYGGKTYYNYTFIMS